MLPAAFKSSLLRQKMGSRCVLWGIGPSPGGLSAAACCSSIPKRTRAYWVDGCTFWRIDAVCSMGLGNTTYRAVQGRRQLLGVLPPLQVQVLVHPQFSEFQAAVGEFKPTMIYLCGPTSYEQNRSTGTIGPLQFKGRPRSRLLPVLFSLQNGSWQARALQTSAWVHADGAQSGDALALACAGVETVYLDAATHENIGEAWLCI